MNNLHCNRAAKRNAEMRSSRAASTILLCILCASCAGATVAFQARSSFAGGVRFGVSDRSRCAAAASPRRSRRSAGNTLAMHFGHSHSHHHHSHEEKINGDDSAAEVAAAPPKSALGRALFLTRRRPARIAFAALAVLGPALARTRRVSRTDLALFAITSAVLSLFDAGRREVKAALDRINSLRRGFVKHAPTLEELSPRRMMRGGDGSAADRVTLLGVLINLILSVGKAFVGVTCHSSALIADAGHSLSDLFSDFITLWAVQVGRLPPDDDHPYGHGKFEAVGSLFLALTLLGTGLGVGAASNRKLLEILSAQRSVGAAAAAAAVEIPTSPALVMAGISIASKEWLYRVTRAVGERLSSQVVIANAWHHRSDAYSSVLALVSIGLAMAVPGLLAADAAAGMLVAGMICMTGAEILGESIKQLTDTSDEGLVRRVSRIVAGGEEGDVLEVKRVRARQVGSSAVVDVSVVTPAGLSSSANRAIEERLRWRIMDEPGVVDAEVRSTSADVKICPLLSAEAARTGDPPSAVDVEDLARTVLEADSRVRSVEGVTVHFQDTLLTNVDATIRMENLGATVTEAAELGKQLRETLEGEENIHRASIFLDLNEGAVPAVAAAMPIG